MTSRSLFLLFFLSGCFLSRSQDTIRFRDGRVHVVKVEEVGSTTIKYKKSDYLNGPTYSVPVSQVEVVIYRNGARENLNPAPAPSNAQNFPSYQPPSAPPANTDAVPTSTATQRMKFGGPRIGCTYIGEGTAAQWFRDRGKQPFVSQFGWQFETRFFTTSGFTGLIEFIPLLAGFEQGVVIPSASLLVGLRGRDGYELALGPNASPTGFGMAFAVGTSFRSGDVYFPVNIGFVPSVNKTETTVSYSNQKHSVTTHTGFRLTLLIGFNTRKK
jgi:hypothetical protein